MAKPTYEELEKKLKPLEHSQSRITHLEDQLAHLEDQFLQVEKQLRQRQRMDSLGTLAQGVAHDFNNILGGILGYAQLLQFELNHNQNCLSYTKQIVAGCNRAKNLIFQILFCLFYL